MKQSFLTTVKDSDYLPDDRVLFKGDTVYIRDFLGIQAIKVDENGEYFVKTYKASEDDLFIMVHSADGLGFLLGTPDGLELYNGGWERRTCGG